MPQFLRNSKWVAWFRRIFTGGVNSDVRPEVLKDGLYNDALNMRPANIDGNTGALESIRGEVIEWPADVLVTDPTSYICIGAATTNGNVTEFWASSNFDPGTGANPPYVRVNGTLSAMSAEIPYVFDKPLQIAPVEDCGAGGVLYPADDYSDPLFWDVQALIDAQGTETYFANFNIEAQMVGTVAPATYPVYDKLEPLVDLGGPVGLSVGQYCYSVRYVTPNGNRTNWGPESPLIPVPFKYTPETLVNPPTGSPQPGGRTFGGDANLIVPTEYGVKMKYRVDNIFGYESVEIKRRRYNDGAGINGLGQEEIVARIFIQPNQVSLLEFVDPADANINPPEPIGADEADLQYIIIKKPKAVEYADQRLIYGNFETEAQPTEVTFTSMSSGVITSITKKLTKVIDGNEIPDGYSNPFNAAYYKSAQRGEKYGYCMQAWNAALGKFLAIPIPGADNYQHPNARDIKGANGAWDGTVGGLASNAGWGVESDLYSDDPCYASTTDVGNQTAEGPVGKTFATFTQGRVTKQNTTQFVNVATPSGSAPGNGVVRLPSQFNLYSFTPSPDTAIVNGPPLFTDLVVPNPTSGYQPWRPVDNGDNQNSYDVPPNTSRLADLAFPAGTGGQIPGTALNPVGFADQCNAFNPAANFGKCFAPTYHALGALIGGIENIPPSVAAISIGRTKPSGRVVMQGFGSYILQERDNQPASKSTNALNVYFPEADAGTIDQAQLQDIIDYPTNYKVQMQCGVGFYTEVYGYSGSYDNDSWAGPTTSANLMDMISYGRIMEDGVYPNGMVNIGEPLPGFMGYQPNPGSAPDGNYVGFDKWRSNLTMNGNTPGPGTLDYSYWQNTDQGQFNNLPTGNKLFDIQNFFLNTEGRASWYTLQTSQFIYSPGTFDTTTDDGANQTAFNNDTVRAFHQPWFILNIIKEGAEVPDDNQQLYIPTGFNMAMRSCIGIFNATGGLTQDFELLDDGEFYNSVGYLGTDYRYAYVQHPTIGEQAYLCVTNNTQIVLSTVLLDIANIGYWTAPDGTLVYGLYDAVQNNSINYLRFGVYATFPPLGSRIVVRYPEGTPIRVFGHDVTVAPNVHSVKDGFGNRTDVDAGTGGGLNINGLPLPHPGFGMNPRYFMPESQGQTEEQIWINYCKSIRQWCIMSDLETRLQPAMYVNLDSEQNNIQDQAQMFPFIHYVTRGYVFNNPPASGAAFGFFPEYDSDYPSETTQWRYGGLRFRPTYNLDYARQPDPDFVGLPQTGYIDDTDRCTWLAASEKYDPALQDTPNIRAFLSQNMKPLSEENGEIKVIASATYPGNQGQNLYVWLEGAVSRVLMNKNILAGASGEQISTYVISNFWGDEMRLTRSIGSPGQFWRLWSKGYAPAGGGYADTFMWPDKRGWYMMRADNIDDISRNKYLKTLLPILNSLPNGYFPHVTSFYNTKYQEMWACIPAFRSGATDYPPHLVVYSPQTNEWLGEYSYQFDEFLNTRDGVLAMRNSETYSLDEGFVINGEVREAWVEVPVVGELGKYKEMVRWRVVGDKPDEMTLKDQTTAVMSIQSEAIQEAYEAGTGALWAKLYDSFEGWWWRTMTSYDPNQRLPQDVRFFVKVRYTTEGDKTIFALENQLKNIR